MTFGLLFLCVIYCVLIISDQVNALQQLQETSVVKFAELKFGNDSNEAFDKHTNGVVTTYTLPKGHYFEVSPSMSLSFVTDNDWNHQTLLTEKTRFTKSATVIISIPIKTKKLLPPCFDSKYYQTQDTSFCLPMAKTDRHGNTVCISVEPRQKAYTLEVFAENETMTRITEIAYVNQAEYYFWTSEELEPASTYCRKKESKCSDNDPLVFYSDEYVGFWQGWGSDRFQGYEITPNTKYDATSNSPSAETEFKFLKYAGYVWASSKHFGSWCRDALLTDGKFETKLLLKHPTQKFEIKDTNTASNHDGNFLVKF